MDYKFQLSLLGVPEIVWLNQPFTLARRQARALLYRLANEMQPVPRDQLIFLLWSDIPEATARRNLTRLLSYIHQTLPQADLLRSEKSAVALNSTLVASDTVRFTQLCAADEVAGWERAVSLYRGRFLDGVSLPDSPEFDQWLSQSQRHYERTYLETLGKLVRTKTDKRDPAAAIHYAQQYLATDDLAEDIHRRLINLYAASGDRSAALQQFEQCLIVLERELGVAPLPETRAAYESARDGSKPPSLEEVPKPEWTTLPGLNLPLIGRDEAWQALTQAYGRYQSGGVIFISGEAGVGKSRLMQEFAIAQSGLVLTGNSQATAQALPYQPLVQALRLALPLSERWIHTQSVWLAQVSRLLPELQAKFLDLSPPAETAPQQTQAHLFEALSEVFISLAIDSPLLLCLDDVHWADETTIGWLQYVTKRLLKSNVCILATYRTHEAERLKAWQSTLDRAGQVANIRLTGLSEMAVVELLYQAGTDQTTSHPLAARIHTATGGNAFFVLEMIRELLGTNQSPDHLVDLPLPQTVRDAVLHRAARLTPLTQQIVAVAAILSPHITVETLVETSGRGELETVNSLDELLAHQLLEAEYHNFRFHHDLARQSIYENITPWRQQVLHRRAGEGLERLFQTNLAPFYPSLAYHWSQVIERKMPDPRLVSKTIGYLQRAGEQAVESFASQEAVNFFNQALTLLYTLPPTPERDRQEIDLQLAIGPALRAVKGYLAPEVEQTYIRARELCQELGETSQLLPVLWGSWSHYMMRAKHKMAYELAEQSLHLAKSQEDPALQVMAHQIIGGTLCWLGEFTSALDHLEQGIALYDPQYHQTQVRLYGHDFGVLCLALSAKILWFLGYPDQALKRIDEAFNLAQEFSIPFSLGYVYIMAAWLHTDRREGQVAQKWIEAAIILSTKHGFSTWGVWATIHLGAALAEQGQAKEGIIQMNQGLKAWQALGANLTVSYSLARLAKAHGQLRQTEEGLVLLTEALAMAENNDEYFWEAELCRINGDLLLAHNADETEAEQQYYKAINISRRQSAKSLELRASVRLARLWQQQGKLSEAYQTLSEIYNQFTEGFDTADLKEAKVLLEALS